MTVEIITKEELNQFRLQLLEDLKHLLSPVQSKPAKQWLKASEVRKLLGISTGTLQNLRIQGKLRSSKISGIHYYQFEDIDRLMNSAKT